MREVEEADIQEYLKNRANPPYIELNNRRLPEWAINEAQVIVNHQGTKAYAPAVVMQYVDRHPSDSYIEVDTSMLRVVDLIKGPDKLTKAKPSREPAPLASPIFAADYKPLAGSTNPESRLASPIFDQYYLVKRGDSNQMEPNHEYSLTAVTVKNNGNTDHAAALSWRAAKKVLIPS